MWENAAQMQIVSFNWWQYAGRVGSHANSAQPPNLHLAPKLKINMAHWNNSLHIGGTWYCPSDPYTSSVCPPLAARRALTRRGMPSTRVCTLPARTAPYAWRTALFSSAMVEGGSSVSRIQTDIWSQSCSIGFMSGLRAGQSMTSTSCCSKRTAVSRAVWGWAFSWAYTKLRPNTPVAHGNICFPRNAGSWLHPPRPTHSSPHGGLHPIPWVTDHDFHQLAGRRHQSASPLAYGAPGGGPSLWYREDRDS